ncbi:ribokinase [Paenibacillus sp. ACRRX]|uniref:ribokinase n=1 Tax=Paenibacillus sp. ACRRX TaxID=2918206 RepID=UPI001EF43B8C|nr:ribokinase [Paenibacillus sp. ACRRX]MCG7410495.1 ribokinase [Paenibacillus sp. ACRRX]
MRFLNFGSLNLDKVYTVPHFVTGGETLSSVYYAEYAGGKGLNQSIALARSGSQTFHAGKIGSDGLFLKNELASEGVHVEGIYENGLITGHAIIQVASTAENCILLYGGANKEITSTQMDKVIENFDSGDFLVLQNEINDIDYLISAAHKKGLTIVLNPSPMSESIRNLDFSKIDYLILNEIEGHVISGEKSPSRILDYLLSHYNHLKIVLTLGAHGAVYKDNTQEYRQEAYHVKVVDTTAAGDTFLGYFLSIVSQKSDVKLALRVATKAASLAVSQKGSSSSIPFLAEVIG